MAALVVIKPANIIHRKLYLSEENRNYADVVSFMAAVKETYIEKMINASPTLSVQTFCSQCFRCFQTPFDLQVHRELVHQTQHAATCRICEFNFSEPALLLKHMAAVHSMETPPHGLLGAYRCQICRFMSPLYSELTRHYNEYHSRSGWLLCPLCLRVFSNDSTYEHHMNTHIQKGKWFRCQSCRLVFESEAYRQRHEQEMHHSRGKHLTANEFNPKVPVHVRAWVRGDADTRSTILNIEDLDENLASRGKILSILSDLRSISAICMHDCTDAESIQKEKEKAVEKKVTKSNFIKKPLSEIIAPKEFHTQILEGKTRGERKRFQNLDLVESKSDENGRNEHMVNDMRNGF